MVEAERTSNVVGIFPQEKNLILPKMPYVKMPETKFVIFFLPRYHIV